MQVTVDDRELRAFSRRLALAGKHTPKNIKRALSAIGARVAGTAKDLCPESMDRNQYIKTLKTGKTKRRNFHRGQLKKSIRADVFPERVEIGVPSNKPAAAYAEKIHDKWEPTDHNPPPKQKEYITGAYKKEQRNIVKELDIILDEIIRRI